MSEIVKHSQTNFRQKIETLARAEKAFHDEPSEKNLHELQTVRSFWGSAEVLVLLDENARLTNLAQEGRKAIEGLLECEKEHAKHSGLSDCCCMSLSRKYENLYERGQCPHQAARALIPQEPGEKGK